MVFIYIFFGLWVCSIVWSILRIKVDSLTDLEKYGVRVIFYGSFVLFLVALSAPNFGCAPPSFARRPLSPNDPINFGFATANDLFVLQSNGPNGVQDFRNLGELLAIAASVEEAEKHFAVHSYDPTNGSLSSGDLFRVSKAALN
ncbi:MAG: hypothetical protein ACFCU1_11745 [Sumerlaeia bacterium]